MKLLSWICTIIKIWIETRGTTLENIRRFCILYELPWIFSNEQKILYLNKSIWKSIFSFWAFFLKIFQMNWLIWLFCHPFKITQLQSLNSSWVFWYILFCIRGHLLSMSAFFLFFKPIYPSCLRFFYTL